jgi:hypothetical protein
MPERLFEHERDSGWSTHSATDAASGKDRRSSARIIRADVVSTGSETWTWLLANGMTMRDMYAHLFDISGIELSERPEPLCGRRRRALPSIARYRLAVFCSWYHASSVVRRLGGVDGSQS